MTATEDRSIESLSFWAGICVSIVYIPVAVLDLKGRAGAIGWTITLIWPFALAAWTLRSRNSSNSVLALLTKIWIASFLFSTVAGLIIWPHQKLITIIGGTTCLLVCYAGADTLAQASGERAIQKFLDGIQLGFIIFFVALFASGNLVQADIGRGIIGQTFTETENVGRNAVTLVALNALAASLSGMAIRNGRRRFTLLNFAASAISLYLVYIIPGKGAWFGAALVLLCLFGLLLVGGRWYALVVLCGTSVFLVPFMYERISQYLFVYIRVGGGLTLSGRLFLWKAAIRAVAKSKAYLFGFGYDSAFEVASKVLSAKLLHFHNEFINAYYDGGVIGSAVLFSAFFLAAFTAMKLAIKSVRGGNDRGVVYCFFVAAIISSRLMTDVTLTTFNFMIPVWFYCNGLIISRSRKARPVSERPTGNKYPGVALPSSTQR